MTQGGDTFSYRLMNAIEGVPANTRVIEFRPGARIDLRHLEGAERLVDALIPRGMDAAISEGYRLGVRI